MTLALTNGKPRRLDASDIKRRARGRELDILECVAGIPRQHLDGNGHECKKCGTGTDRFSLTDAERGSVICRHCFTQKNGDYIAAVMHFRGVDFREALRLIDDYLGNSPAPMTNGKPSPQASTVRSYTTSSTGDEWRKFGRDAVQFMQHHPQTRKPLANTLRIPEAALDDFDDLGALNANGSLVWFTPEYDADGSLYGYSRRFQNGKKWSLKGSKRGLALPRGVAERAKRLGILFIVEGFSDTAAFFHAGQAVIGSPGKDGKLSILSDWIKKNIPSDVRIIVVVENDTEETRRGRMEYAAKLDAASGRTVETASPPHGFKDVRDALVDDTGEWMERGESLAFYLCEGAEPAGATDPEDRDDRERPEIVIGADEKRVNDEALASIKGLPGLYAYAGTLCTIVYNDETRCSHIRTVTAARLREMLAEAARFVRLRNDKDEGVVKVDAHPPDWCVDAILARGEYPGFRQLSGVADFPYITAAGRIVNVEGYDEETRQYASASAAVEIEVPDQPNQEDAALAAKVLLDLIQDFPVDEESMRAAFVAATMTAPARTAFSGACPGLLIDASTPGTGKGLMVALLGSIVANGEPAIEMLHTEPSPLKTQLTSIVKAGRRIVNFDNLPPNLRSAVLDGFLTATTWTDRLYHTQTEATWPNRTFAIFNGNNVQPHEDTARRLLFIRLRATHERPEDRTDFKYPDLLGHVAANRPKILGAVFTILKAYINAGKPPQPTAAWGSFEGWRNLVANACVFAGLPDPTRTKRTLQDKAGNPLAAFGVVLRALSFAAGNSGLTGKEFIAKLQPRDGFDAPSLGDIAANDVLAALETLTDGDPAKKIGYLFRKYEGRIIGDLRLMRCNRSGGGARFRAGRASEDGDDSADILFRGEMGTCTNSPLSGTSASSASSTRPPDPEAADFDFADGVGVYQ
jgi:phage/plasmid primase-like uncharacterized protein